jgi:hypothetical protein
VINIQVALSYTYTKTELQELLNSLIILIDSREQENQHITGYLNKIKTPYKSKLLGGDYINEQINEYIIFYFTGRYDHIIKTFKRKLKEKIPDDLYCSIGSIDYTRIRIENNNGYSDPTGNIATKIADLQLNRIREYNHYLLLRQLIEDIIKELNHNDIKL